MRVKKRLNEIEDILKKAGANGMEEKEFIKICFKKLGFHVKTIEEYIYDLIKLEKARKEGSRIYHSMFILPSNRKA